MIRQLGMIFSRAVYARNVTALLIGAIALVSEPAASGAPVVQGSPNFAKDVAPIIYANCVVCHRPGQAAPFPLIGYDEIRSKAEEIIDATGTRRMPPWRAVVDRNHVPLRDVARLTDRQIATLKKWAAVGLPLGDQRRLEPPPPLPRDWPLGIPDMTLTLPRPISIPADSAARIFNVLVPLGLLTDRWIQAIDFQTTAPLAVNHALFFAVPGSRVVDHDDVLPGFAGLLSPGAVGNIGQQMIAADQTLDSLGVWVPGGWPRAIPSGIAHRIPRGWNIVMQLHAPASDTGAIEDGRVALYFAKAAPAKRLMPIVLPPSFGILSGLDIPAGGKRTLSDTFTLPVNVDAIGARGHAHLLGRDMKLTARLPGGKMRNLLSIDQWNPRWHDTYYFAQPVQLPRGTTVHVEINYDNTKSNPRALLTPPRRVVWGPLLTDEIGAMTLLVAAGSAQDADAIALVRSEHFKDLLLKRRP